MKNYLPLIILVFSISCYCLNEEIQNQETVQINKDYVKNRYQENSDAFQRNDNYYDEEYVGNPDFDAKIERPCRVFDLNCIRKYFSEHSNCKIRRGPLPTNLFISQHNLYYSRINVTAALENVGFNGFRNTRIEEFYINRRTNKMVFSIQSRNLAIFIPSAYLSFFRKGWEPIVSVAEAGALFPSVTFTAIIPNIDDLQLKNAEITAYVDAAPFFFVGPEVTNSPDPTVVQALAEAFADIPTNTQEMLLTESQFFPPAYIQYNICDFGLKVLPVDIGSDVHTIQQ